MGSSRSWQAIVGRAKEILGIIVFVAVCFAIVFAYERTLDNLPQWAIDIGALLVGLVVLLIIVQVALSIPKVREEMEEERRKREAEDENDDNGVR